MRSDTVTPKSAYRTRHIATRVVLFVLLCLMSVPFIFPTWWMITASFKPISEIFANPPTLWPQAFTAEPYLKVFTTQPFAQQYFNSVYIAVVVTACSIVVCSLAGYAFARIRFPGANILFVVVLLGMMIPSEVTIVPLYRMMSTFGLLDTHWPLILIPIFGAPSVMGTFIMRQFFLGLPLEYEEAGRLDGLSRFGLFWRVGFPLARPAVAAVAIIVFLRAWNSYLEPLVYISDKQTQTLPVALTLFKDSYGTPLWNVQLAATTLTVIPILIVFLFAQRQFVQGLAQTGLKG
jgi:multiple sugar transport system permease protein